MKNYFGTDGIRFVYNEEVKSLISKIGNALSYFKNKTVIIGCDTRFSSPEIVKLLTHSIINKEIKYIGICSTPCISYLSKKYKCLGIMITASHNPYYYNGIKIFNNGFKIQTKEQEILSNLINKNNNILLNKKEINIDDNLLNEYLLFLLSFAKNSNKRMIFDVGNGSLSHYINKIIKPINKHNIAINYNPDGYNINDRCGATDVNNLISQMKILNIDYGFSFDGDADRIIMVYKDQILDGDKIIYILSQFINKKTIVLSNNSNLGLIKSLQKRNFKIKVVDVGDYHILSYLKKHHLILGGENSGHIIQYDKLITGDGLLNAIILINILNNYDIKDLLNGYIDYPHKLISFTLNNNNTINHPLIQKTIQDYKSLYKDDINLNIRISGTENKIRIYVCYKEQNILNKIISHLITLIKLIDFNIEFENIQNTFIDEHSTFGSNVTLKGQIQIVHSHIKNNVSINNSIISSSTIEDNCTIGPFAHLRNNTYIYNNVRIGNFVEIKNSTIGKNSKIAHLTYIGDCVCGEKVNFGCGVVICNYDGKNKHQTIIGNKVFIGSNSNLIAPLNIEDNVFIAAGSTVTTSVPDNSFVIARNKQITKKLNKNYPYFQEE